MEERGAERQEKQMTRTSTEGKETNVIVREKEK